MEQYMKATATPFVHHALKDTILKIMESKQSCEVDAPQRRFSPPPPPFLLYLRCKAHHIHIIGDIRTDEEASAFKISPDFINIEEKCRGA